MKKLNPQLKKRISRPKSQKKHPNKNQFLLGRTEHACLQHKHIILILLKLAFEVFTSCNFRSALLQAQKPKLLDSVCDI